MKKILIIGDSCIDEYVYGYSDRMSPEAPVPIFKPLRYVQTDGMAMNVYSNLQQFYNVHCKVITNSDNKPKKVRYVDSNSNHLYLRIDYNDNVKRIDNDVLKSIHFNDYDVIVISDYNKGFLTEEDIEFISQQNVLTFLDTKKKIGNWAKNINFIKINMNEYTNNIEWLKNEYKNNLIVTHGSEGAFYINHLNNIINLIPVNSEVIVRDVSGAGDTFLAGLVIKYIEDNDIEESIKFANKCASWIVTQKGVAIINPNKI